MNISPNDSNHSTLENDVKNFLISRGYYIASATYHDVMDRTVVRRLTEIYTPNSLYVRSRSDKVAVHREKDIVLEYDPKTAIKNKPYATFEVYPICQNAAAKYIFKDCLYIYRDKFNDIEVGIWIEELIKLPISVIIIPSIRWNEEKQEMFRGIFELILPNTRIHIAPKDRNYGTNDPFLTVDNRFISKFQHWKDCIDNFNPKETYTQIPLFTGVTIT